MDTLAGINVQYPVSTKILEGCKRVETRTYPIPSHFIGRPMLLIETPGREGGFKARIAGIVWFGSSFEYPNEDAFYHDEHAHLVGRDSKWKWIAGKRKFGWPILHFRKLESPLPVNQRRGICFTKDIGIPREVVRLLEADLFAPKPPLEVPQGPDSSLQC